MFKSRIKKLEERVKVLEEKTAPSAGESIHFQPLIISEISERKKLEDLMKKSIYNRVSITFPAEIPCEKYFTDGIDYTGAIERLKERKDHLP